MGKNHKHKKQLKSEKAKVKLRGGSVKNEKTKFLPKGLNVTDLSFKVKQIVLPTQLQEKDDNEIRSRRKLNCKELLARLKHHNIMSKVEACEELSQILTAHSEELERNYAVVLKGLCPLILDVEKKVRNCAIHALDSILRVSVIEKLEPFFNVIFSYLKCGLTHLDISIQEDALKIVDSLLKYAPGLISGSATTIIAILISLMSKQGHSSSSSSKNGKIGNERTLTVVLEKKLTSTKWRIKVLERINKILNTVLSKDLVQAQEESKIRKGIFCEKINFVGLYKNFDCVSTFPISYLDGNSSSCSMQDQCNLIDVAINNSLVGLLFEIWLEESNCDQMKEDMTLLSQDNAVILSLVLNIIDNLWKLLNLRRMESSDLTKEQFVKQFNSSSSIKFWDKVLQQFPYGLLHSQVASSSSNSNFNSGRGGGRKAGNNNKKEFISQTQITDSNCTNENLLICKLFSTFRTNPVRKLTDLTTILNCVEDILRKGKIPNDCIDKLPLFLSMILIEKSMNWSKRGVCFKSLLENLVKYYEKLNICKTKIELFILFCKLSTIPHLTQNVNFISVFTSFPSVVSSQYFGIKAMEAMKLIVRQQHPVLYTDVFSKNISSILDIIFDNKKPDSSKRTLMEMLVFIPKFSKEQEEKIKIYLEADKTACSKYLGVCMDVRRTIDFNKRF